MNGKGKERMGERYMDRQDITRDGQTEGGERDGVMDGEAERKEKECGEGMVRE